MATYYSDAVTLEAAGKALPTAPGAGGVVKCKIANYELAAAVAADVIQMVSLKKGDVPIWFTFFHDDVSASAGACDLGTTGAGAAYLLDDHDLATAALIVCPNYPAADEADALAGWVAAGHGALGVAFTADDTIDVTLAGSGTFTGTLGLIVWYVSLP